MGSNLTATAKSLVSGNAVDQGVPQPGMDDAGAVALDADVSRLAPDDPAAS